MDKKEQFKAFVRKHPILIEYVENNQMTWQKFYEIHDLYGEDETVWNKYLNNTTKETNTKTPNWSDLINMAKSIDVDKVQSGITSLQKALGLVSDLFIKDNNQNTTTYTPRPLYRSFED